MGLAGPRLKSGGDGPIAVVVDDLGPSDVPDLAVVNGGSGTITELPGVGRGFFNDQDPQTLFRLGSALVQPPRSWARAVWATPSRPPGIWSGSTSTIPTPGASVVFSGQQVVAAQALASGQVVVALADSVVDVLGPQGNGLFVQSQLLAAGTTAALPSSIEVLARSNGVFDVLVSSQGSDNLSVYTLGGAIASGGVTPSPAGASLPTQTDFQPPTATPAALVVLTSNATAASASATAATHEQLGRRRASGALSATATSAVGLSLGGFSSLGNGSSRGDGDAVLVSVEGNTYMSVPILNFGAENDEVGQGENRMPWLSALHPLGDATPLTRFIMGLDEALRDYRGTDQRSFPWGPPSAHDPWSEDLFQRHLPADAGTFGPEKDGSSGGRDPSAAQPDPRRHPAQGDRANHPSFGDRPPDEPGVPASSPASWIVAGLKAMAALLATVLVSPASSRCTSSEQGTASVSAQRKTHRDEP